MKISNEAPLTQRLPQAEAELYNFTIGETFYAPFPLSPDLVDSVKKSGQEIMVTAINGQSIGEVGISVDEAADFAAELEYAGVSPEDLGTLLKTYFLSEMRDHIKSGGAYAILDVGGLYVHDDNAMGRFLYEEGYASFPVKVPEELEEYMDYAALFRDAAINMDIRRIGNSLIFEENGVNPPMQREEAPLEKAISLN